jgi:hypothetical protein
MSRGIQPPSATRPDGGPFKSRSASSIHPTDNEEAPCFRAMTRKPSCLISWIQQSPDGGDGALGAVENPLCPFGRRPPVPLHGCNICGARQSSRRLSHRRIMRAATRARPRPQVIDCHSTGWLVLGLRRKRSATASPMIAQTSATMPRTSIAQAVPVPLNSILVRPRLKQLISVQIKRTILTSDQLTCMSNPISSDNRNATIPTKE